MEELFQEDGTIPAGLNIVDTSVDNDPLAKTKEGTTFPKRTVLGVGNDLNIGKQGADLLGTPSKTGIGVDDLLQPETTPNQTPAPDPNNLGDEDLSKLAAIIAATSLTSENLKNTVGEAVCDSLDGGCMKTKLKDPLDGRLDGLNAILQGVDLKGLFRNSRGRH
ncbi:MAG: hypothetical protein QNJ34_19360 [Xenococcaceae cyanobacterium MO_188.B29]|nr:hypothetical protein [Xenococcaceae cyanobacterium MO_188.B29]